MTRKPDPAGPSTSRACVPAADGSRRGAVPAHSDVVVLIATPGSYRTHAFAKAGTSLGLTPLVVTESTAAAVPPGTLGISASLSDAGAILHALQRVSDVHQIKAVVGVDDGTVEMAARVARELGLPHNDPASAKATRDKIISRQLLASASALDVPQHLHVGADEVSSHVLPAFASPWVVKPTTLSASRGVIRVDSHEQLGAVIDRVRSIATQSGQTADVLVEAFVAGTEIAVEAVLEAGELSILAVFDKPDPLNGPYFEESYYIAPGRLTRVQHERIERVVAEACRVLGLSHGPIHAELRLDGEFCWILEVAARTIGGDCAGLFSLATGADIESLVICTAAGRKLERVALEGGAGVLMIPVPGAGVLRRVEGITDALAVPGVLDVRIDINEGYELVPWPEGNAYPGFIFASADSPDAAEAALREAHAALRFVLAPILPVMVTNKNGAG